MISNMNGTSIMVFSNRRSLERVSAPPRLLPIPLRIPQVGGPIGRTRATVRLLCRCRCHRCRPQRWRPPIPALPPPRRGHTPAAICVFEPSQSVPPPASLTGPPASKCTSTDLCDTLSLLYLDGDAKEVIPQFTPDHLVRSPNDHGFGAAPIRSPGARPSRP